MTQTPIRGIPQETPLRDLSDRDLLSLWSEMTRHQSDIREVESLVRRGAASNDRESRLVALFQEMCGRKLSFA